MAQEDEEEDDEEEAEDDDNDEYEEDEYEELVNYSKQHHRNWLAYVHAEQPDPISPSLHVGRGPTKDPARCGHSHTIMHQHASVLSI